MALDSEDYDMINGRLLDIENQLDMIADAADDFRIILNAIFGGSLQTGSIDDLLDAGYEPADLAQNLAEFVHDFNCCMYEISERNLSQMGGDSDE